MAGERGGRGGGADREEYEEPLAEGEPEALGAGDTGGPPPLEREEVEMKRTSQPIYTTLGPGKLGPRKGQPGEEEHPDRGTAGRAGTRSERGGGGAGEEG